MQSIIAEAIKQSSNISLCLLFASVGQASARTIASLPWTMFTSLLTHRLVLLCIDAHCFIFWDLPGDVLAAPESALGLNRCNTSLFQIENFMEKHDHKTLPLQHEVLGHSHQYINHKRLSCNH